MMYDLLHHDGWNFQSVLTGPTGPRGTSGSRGEKGVVGGVGPSGWTGPTGDAGEAGARGIEQQGPQADGMFVFTDAAEMPIHATYAAAAGTEFYRDGSYYVLCLRSRVAYTGDDGFVLKFRPLADPPPSNTPYHVEGGFYLGIAKDSSVNPMEEGMYVRVEINEDTNNVTHSYQSIDKTYQFSIGTYKVNISLEIRSPQTTNARITVTRGTTSDITDNPTSIEYGKDKHAITQTIDIRPVRGSYYDLVSSDGVARAYCDLIDMLPATTDQKTAMKAIYGA